MTQKFEHINDARHWVVDKLSNDALLGRKGNILRQSLYIWNYKPEQEQFAKDLLQAISTNDLPGRGVTPLIVDIYDIVLEYLDTEEMWEPLIAAEGEASREELIMMLQDTVSVTDVVAPKVNALIEGHTEADIVFLTGVGETYPFVRTHSILAELSTTKPIVLMFPGRFEQRLDGSTSLDILNIEQSGSGGYYRATNVYDL